MQRAGIAALAVIAVALAACSRAPSTPTHAATSPAPAAIYSATPWTLVAGRGSAQPDLIATADGRLLLAWISEEAGRRPALLFSTFDGARWTQAARTVAVGTGLFANWADTPHLAATADGAFWVHWLQRSPASRDAYDILLSRSRSNGRSWSPPVLVNDDATASEHGFVSLWAQSPDTLGAAWLDGRNSITVGHDGQDAHAGHAADTADGGNAAHPADAGTAGIAAHAGSAPAMSLRAARFDAHLQRLNDVQIDARTCDCCQTDVAMTTRGPLLAYRGRTADEIRDILVTRDDGAGWSTPRRVAADDWRMPACPVNGPAVTARGNAAIVAWYTAAGDVPTVKVAHSANAGDSFGAPRVLDRGEAVQGRVDAAHGGNQAWVLWLREDTSGQSLWLARLAPDLSRELQRIEVARLQGRGRATGFPKLALRGDSAYIAWTDIVDGIPRLQGAVVAPAPR